MRCLVRGFAAVTMTAQGSTVSGWARPVLTVVSVALASTFILALAGVAAGLMSAIPVAPGLVYSRLAWTLIAAAICALTAGAWLVSSRATFCTLDCLVLAGAPIAAALVGASEPSAAVSPLVFGAVIASALASRRLRRFRMAAQVLCAVAAVGIVAFAVLAAGVSAIDARGGATHMPEAVSGDGELSAVAVVVREGAVGSDFQYVVVAPKGPHLLEQIVQVDDASFGEPAVWIGPRTLQVGETIAAVAL